MIEAWIDGADVFFCEGGRIDLHLRTGTCSDKAIKVAEFETNSMPEAHKMFAKHLEEKAAETEMNDLLGINEGWD